MKILMVSPYPPVRDGIASYAVQQVKALLDAGHEVEVLSPGPSAAHHHLDLVGPRGALALAKRVPAYDKVIVQFHPDFFYEQPSTPANRVAESLALVAAFRRAREVEVVVHEIDYRLAAGRRPDALAMRAVWGEVDRVLVHTEKERRDFAAAFGVPVERVELTAHGAHFVSATRHDRASARASLGVPADAFTFLSIGFIQPHKGFDRAIEAFDGLGPAGARLDVVGSVRVEEPEFLAYAAELKARARQVAGVHVHEGYVSDELFDRWIVAADVLVLPYRSVWSSGVLERAALLDRPVIASAVGGLAGQAEVIGNAVTFIESDAELRSAMWQAHGGAEPVGSAAPWTSVTEAEGIALHRQVQEQVRARAAAAGSRRPGGSTSTRDTTSTGDAVTARRASAALRRLPPAGPAHPTSARPFASTLKRVVRKATAWQTNPLIDQVNALRAASIEAVEQLATRDEPPGSDVAGAPRERR